MTATIKIDGIEFIGPYPVTSLFENKSGVYLVLCGYIGTKYLMWGESHEVKDRIEKHERKD